MSAQSAVNLNSLEAITRRLEMRLKQPLPGEKAQFKMAPYKRPGHAQALKENPNPRRAGVLALFFEKNHAPHLLLMQRNEYDGAHSGQVCMPGGSVEGSDQNYTATALREAHEELNVNPEKVKVLGTLSPLYIPPSRFLIHPTVGVYSGPPLWKPDDYEVQKIHEIGVSELTHPDSVTSGHVYAPSLKTQINVPYYRFKQCTVWGATAMVLSELNAILYE